MSFDDYFARYEGQLTDFWGRRENNPVHRRVFRIFGRPIQLSSNDKQVLEAVDFSLPLYSSAPTVDDKPFEIEIVVRRFAPSPDPVPDNLFDYIQYSGHTRWLAMQLGSWGHCQVDLEAGKARAILSLELGCRPEAISRFLLNTIINNLMKTVGLGMLHTTAVYQDGRIFMMLAGHNSGKSTTALRLALAGFKFVSDSQIYIESDDERLALYGFPVGRAKLRPDMLSQFPRLETFLESEPVRQEMKFRLDLHRVDPDLVYDGVIHPEKIFLCLLNRYGSRETVLETAEKEEVLGAAMVNSLYFDDSAVWRKNFEQIERLVERAECYQLSIGTEVSGIIQAVDRLMG